MSESLTVRSRLELTSNVPEVMRQMVRAFENGNAAIKSMQDSLSRLGSRTGGLNKIAETIDKLSGMRLGGGMLADMSAMVDRSKEMATQTRLMAESADKAAAAWRAMAAARVPTVPASPSAPGPGPSRRGHGGSSALMDAAIGGQLVGDAGLNVVEQGFMANAAIQQQVILLQADKRVTNAVVAKLSARIAHLQQQNPALQQLEGLKLFQENMGVFGNADEALATLPGSVRLQQLYSLSGLSKGGTGGDENLAATKAGDALQAFINPKTKQIDTALFNKWIDFQTKSALAGGGIVDAKSWLTFARTARTGGIGLNTDAMEYAQALLELSPGRTGTALMSTFQLLTSGSKMLSGKNRSAWQGMGLMDKKGNLKNAAEAQSDPFTWTWDTLLPLLAKHGIKSQGDILKWITANSQRGTVAGVLSDIAIGETNIQKTKTRFDAQDPNTVDKLQQSDIGKLAALATAENNFLIALGKFEEGPGVAILTDLTKGLNSLTAWATAHPKLAKDLAVTGAGMAILAKAGGDLALTIYLGAPLVTGMAALAKSAATFAGSGSAAAGLGVVIGFMARLSAIAAVLNLKGDTNTPPPKDGTVAPGGMSTFKNGQWNDTQMKDGQLTPDKKWIYHQGRFFDYVTPAPPPAPYQGPAHHTGLMLAPGQTIQAHVVNIADMAKGSVSYLARQFQRPTQGTTGPDVRVAPQMPGNPASAI